MVGVGVKVGWGVASLLANASPGGGDPFCEPLGNLEGRAVAAPSPGVFVKGGKGKGGRPQAWDEH